jgi:hypothetical protein
MIPDDISCIRITHTGAVLDDHRSLLSFDKMPQLDRWDQDGKFGQNIVMLWSTGCDEPFNEIGTLLLDDLFKIEQIHGDIYFCKNLDDRLVSFEKSELDALVAKFEVMFVFFKKDNIWNDGKER